MEGNEKLFQAIEEIVASGQRRGGGHILNIKYQTFFEPKYFEIGTLLNMLNRSQPIW
jgi:hypothetical protein